MAAMITEGTEQPVQSESTVFIEDDWPFWQLPVGDHDPPVAEPEPGPISDDSGFNQFRRRRLMDDGTGGFMQEASGTETGEQSDEDQDIFGTLADMEQIPVHAATNLPRQYEDLAQSLGNIMQVAYMASDAAKKQGLKEYHEKIQAWILRNEDLLQATIREYMESMDYAKKHGDDKPRSKLFSDMPPKLIDWIGTMEDAEYWLQEGLQVPIRDILHPPRASSGSSNGIIIIGGLLVLAFVFSQ